MLKTLPPNLDKSISNIKKRPFLTAFVSIAGLIIPGISSALLPFANTGDLFVSIWTANEIAIFDPATGVEKKRFTTDGLDGPRGIAFNPANGEMWVASEFGNKVFIFDHEQKFLRTFSHPDFDEPVGISFRETAGIAAIDQEVYISNSGSGMNDGEIMVFNQAGELQRRFTQDNFDDPNCSAFMPDGSFFVSNRVGGDNSAIGSVNKFDALDAPLLNFTAPGISSLMAVARDPNGAEDDTIWATSGGGSRGTYEFNLDGSLKQTILPTDITQASNIVPQGIAFDDQGNFIVVSFENDVFKFSGDGTFLSSFSTGTSGASRSTAFQGCEGDKNTVGCIPLGSSNTGSSSPATTPPPVTTPATTDTDSGSGGGTIGLGFLSALLTLTALRRRRIYKN